MTNEKLTDTILEISSKISSLEATLISINHNTEKMLEQILAHEQRITTLEQFHKPQNIVPQNTVPQNTTNKDESFKNDMIKLLCKAILIAGISIASLSGAGGIIAKIFGL
jgi:Mg2+ and Co2+ transporter CorA